MTTFLIILLVIWGGWKLLRWWLMRRFTNRTRDIFEQFARQAGAQSRPGADNDTNPHRRDKTGWDRPRDKKKFARDQGEYIEYEDVKITETETTIKTSSDGTATSAAFTETQISEERITDAEWEDIPS